MAFFIQALKPPGYSGHDWNYTRWGKPIPKEEIKIDSLKDFFKIDLSEIEIEKELRLDKRLNFKSDSEKDIQFKEEQKIIEAEKTMVKESKKYASKDKIEKERERLLQEFNDAKGNALNTAGKEDDEAVAKLEIELMEKLKKLDEKGVE